MDLQELVHNAEQLSLKLQSIHSHGSFPPIKKNLNQIEQISKDMIKSTTRGDFKTEVSLLLSHNGIDLAKIEESFESLNRSIEKIQYQKDEQDLKNQSMSEFPSDNTFESIKEWIDKKFEQEINQEFDQIIKEEADKICSDIVIKTITEKFYKEQLEIFEEYSSRFLKLGQEKDGRLVLIDKTMNWLQIIKDLNEARLTNSSFALCQKFEQNSLDNPIILDTWTIISRIIDENPEENDGNNNGIGGGGQIFQIKKNLKKYHDAPKDSPLHLEWKKQIISGARRASEIIFLRLVDRVLSQYPRDVSLGGRPSISERIKAYTTLFLKRMSDSEMEKLEIYNGVPIWANLFFLIRAGAWKDAISFSEQYELVLDRSESSFVAYLKSFHQAEDYILSGPLKSQIRASFAQKKNNSSSDPYKLAILKLLGRCDLRKRTSEVCSTIEDWLWLQLWLVRDGAALAEESRYTLLELQEYLLELEKDDYFPDKIRYAQALFMSGQFEQALYQLEDSDYEGEMIHMSIALAYYGCLGIEDHISGILFHYGNESGGSNATKQDGSLSTTTATATTTTKLMNVNHVRMMIFYANELYKIDPIESFQYLFLIGLSNLDSCRKAITDFVIKSGDYSNLLGEVQQDGKVSQGLLSKYSKLFSTGDDWFCDLTRRAAVECMKRDQFSDALMLYNLSRDYDKVLAMLSEKLSDHFTIPYDRSKIVGLQQMTNSIIDYYHSVPHINSAVSNQSLWISIEKLLRLLDFRHLFQESRYIEAINCFDDLSLVPFYDGKFTGAATSARTAMSTATSSEMMAAANSASESIKLLPSDVLEILGDALLIYMESLQRAYQQSKEYVFIDPGRKEQIESMRAKGRSLMLMIGNNNFIRARLGSDITSKMAKMEVTMN